MRKQLRVALVSFSLIFAALAAGQGYAIEPETYRLGVLSVNAGGQASVRRWSLPQLAKLGFAEGRNLVVDERIGTTEALPALASELVALQPQALIAIASGPIARLREATDAIPIVGYGSDPVLLGLAETLTRPGGNVTGVVILGPELDGKRVQMIHEALPAARRVAVLLHRHALLKDRSLREMQAAASWQGLELLPFEVAGRDDYEKAFTAMREAGAQAVVIQAFAALFTDSTLLARLALAAGLPSVCEWREMAQDGCLIGYGPSREQLYRRVGEYVARIFRGASPASLPIEQPTRLELIVNLATAKALGIELAPSFVAGADEVIE